MNKQPPALLFGICKKLGGVIKVTALGLDADGPWHLLAEEDQDCLADHPEIYRHISGRLKMLDGHWRTAKVPVTPEVLRLYFNSALDICYKGQRLPREDESMDTTANSSLLSSEISFHLNFYLKFISKPFAI